MASEEQSQAVETPGSHIAGDGVLHAIQAPVHLPPLWAKNPKAWFAQVETQFYIRCVTGQLPRYYHVVAALPSEMGAELNDVLTAPPPIDPYDNLKTIILNRNVPSESSRLKQLLTTEELGDHRPSQLLHQLRQLLGEESSGANTSILMELFLLRLPQNTRIALASSTDMPLERLAEIADRITEYSAPNMSPVKQQQDSSEVLSALEKRLDGRLKQMTVAVAALQTTRGSERRPFRHRPCNAGVQPAH